MTVAIALYAVICGCCFGMFIIRAGILHILGSLTLKPVKPQAEEYTVVLTVLDKIGTQMWPYFTLTIVTLWLLGGADMPGDKSAMLFISIEHPAVRVVLILVTFAFALLFSAAECLVAEVFRRMNQHLSSSLDKFIAKRFPRTSPRLEDIKS